MLRILHPSDFITTPWKNGGGTTHEIARADGPQRLMWRLSIAEVDSDGAFSEFGGLTRILTVIAGPGIDLCTPIGARRVLPRVPLRFSGDLPVHCVLCGTAVRDLNVIFDAERIEADVVALAGSCRIAPQDGLTGVLALSGGVAANGDEVPEGAVALADSGEITLAEGAAALQVRLRPLG